MQTIDYKAVLADLRARRAARVAAHATELRGLDSAIEAIEHLPEQQRSATLTRGSARFSVDDIPPDAFEGMPMAQAVAAYLRMVGNKGQTTKRLVEAVERGGLRSKSKNLRTTMYSTLARNPNFRRVKKKFWKLAEPAKTLPNGKDRDNTEPGEVLAAAE